MHRNQTQSLKCQKKCNLHKFENQLFEYIHYCTVINVSLLLNTLKFSPYVSVHFVVNNLLSLRMRQMCILEQRNFEISQGSMAPDPSSTSSSGLVPLAIGPIFAGPTVYF